MAYHRQNNFWDLICPLKSQEIEESNVNDIMKDLIKEDASIQQDKTGLNESEIVSVIKKQIH